MRQSKVLSLGVLALVGLCGEAGQIKTGVTKSVYPGKDWEAKRPEEVGLDAAKLKELSDYAGGFGCVVRYGYMVYTWGDASKRNDVASAVKPVYTHFLLKAVEEGKIASIDDRVAKFEPRLNSINEALGYKDRKITWRHLCNQTSCYGVRDWPGDAFDYSDYNMALFFDTLMLKVYGATWETVDANILHPKLTDLLGCQDNPTFMAFGTEGQPGRLAISPRDFARFGLLYLRKGKWQDKQLISAEHVKLIVTSPLPLSIPRTEGKSAEMIAGQRSLGGGNNQCDHNDSYSFAWWVNGIGRDGIRNWPDAPNDVFACLGHGGIRAMVVMPALDLIVSWNDTKIEENKMINHALKLLKDTAIWPHPQDRQIAAEPNYSGYPRNFLSGVERLPEYEALFTRDKGWTGADGVFSLELSENKILWLFSDTWIGDIVDGRHKDATIINNTIALQNGKDPSTASVKFFWRTTKEGKPAAFITPADGVGWFWVFHGVMTDGKLYLFLMQIIKTDEKSVFGFKQIGTTLAQIDNPHDDPLNWRIKQYKVPFGRYSDNGNMFFGSAAMKDEDFVYIYGCNEDWKKGMGGRSMIVARVPPDKITDFQKWRFFSNGDWRADVNGISQLFDGIATEYSVSFQPALKKYVVIYTENGMSANIMMRVSDTPVGPWSRPHKVYECPEVGWHKTYFCYAAKGHQEISSPDELIITYVCNSTDFWQMAKDARIYHPRFLRVKFDVQEHQ